MNTSMDGGLDLLTSEPVMTVAEAGARRSAQSHARKVRERRTAVLGQVRARCAADGVGPTTADLVRTMPLSRTTVHKYVTELLADGSLTRDPSTGELRAS